MAQTLDTKLIGPQGCLNTRCAPSFPEEGHVLAPWVAIRFTEKGGNDLTCITVSNRSTPPVGDCPAQCELPPVPKGCTEMKCNAVIKDFEFGHSEGFNCSVRIIDQQGSEFGRFMGNIISDHCETGPPAMSMVVRYGWIMESCDKAVAHSESECHFMFLDTVDASFAGGKFLYTIMGKDLPSRMPENTGENIVGSDDSPAFMVNAVRETLTDETEPPWVKEVTFIRMECDAGSGTAKEVTIGYNAFDQLDPDAGFDKYHDDRPDLGIKGKWDMKSQDKLQATSDWMAHHGMTKRKKQLKPMHRNSTGGKVEWIEDIVPGSCNENLKNIDCLCWATYIVNGGKESRVIEFNPQVRWNFNTTQAIMGGGIAPKPKGTGRGADVVNKNEGKEGGERRPGKGGRCLGGLQNTLQTDENNLNDGAEEALQTSGTQTSEQLKAWKVMPENIEADLVLQGDPKLEPFYLIGKRTVSIIFVNPYYIMPKEGDSCGDWLVDPVCNDVLTNNNWYIRSVIHKITPGSYTTTLKVYLPAPGVDFDGGAGGGCGKCTQFDTRTGPAPTNESDCNRLGGVWVANT